MSGIRDAEPPPMLIVKSPIRRRRIIALVVALTLPIASIAVAATVIERPFAGFPDRQGRLQRAAVAIRDDVVPFQKWGTRSFTLPSLEHGYDRVWYFTESGSPGTRGAFLEALREACSTCDTVDLFLLAHANNYVSIVAGLDPPLLARLRLVYNTGCGDASESLQWLALGADAFVGHVGTSQSPIFYVYFLRRWIDGWTVADATAAGNAETARVLGIAGAIALSRNTTEWIIAGSHAELSGDGTLTINGVAGG